MPRKTTAVSLAVAGDESFVISIPSDARKPEITEIRRAAIHPDPEQPRQAADTELRDTIARNGLLQPITVRPHPTRPSEWMIVDGERRWRSSEGVLLELPCIVRRDMDALARRLATQLEANTGKLLTPLEEARAFGQIMAHEQIGTSELAAFLGRAPSTVAERVALLELGPWLPLIESGDVVMSHAVKVLLPLRSVPDTYHEHAIALLQKDYRWQNKGRGEGISLGDFERLVAQIYKAAMYPLSKTKTTWHKQPEFSTTKHDAECGCGGVRFAIDGGDSARLCCCDPAWWKPRHAAAAKAKKEKEAAVNPTAVPDQKAVFLPEGATVRKAQSWEQPDGAVVLMGSEGTWEVGYPHNHIDYNPAEIAGNCSPAELVELRSSPHSYPRVAIRHDAPSLAAARTAWASRWQARRAELAKQINLRLTPGASLVQGEGARQLLMALSDASSVGESDDVDAYVLVDVAFAIGLDVPEIADVERWDLAAHITPWVKALPSREVESLASAVASFLSLGIEGISMQVAVEEWAALKAIATKKVPWLKAPKADKGKRAPHPAVALAVAGKQLSPETAELPLDDPRVPRSRFGSSADEDELPDDEQEIPALLDDDEDNDDLMVPAYLSDDDDDGDDLWDSADEDEDDDAEAPLVEARKR